MDIEKFYNETNAGEKVNPSEVLAYIAGFENVVLWGASWLGKSVGAYLQAKGINFKEYWDLRADDIGNLNEKPVKIPFSTEYDREKTLIIYCISNRVIFGTIRKKLLGEGYNYNIAGFNIFMAALCSSNKECGLNMNACVNSRSCLKIYCLRMASLFELKHTDKKQEYPIHLNGITLIVNQICNLSCKHCTSYMNAYSKHERINFPTDDIIRDIHNFFNSVDSVASMTIMGGEPFMHPDISSIMRALLEHDNVGFISIPTNGVFPMKPEQMAGLGDKRVVVAFNNYLPSLPANLRVVFDKNVELVKNAKVAYSIGNFMPNWSIPSTLYNLGGSLDDIKERRSVCKERNLANYGLIHRQLKNGKLFPCDFSNALYSLNIADYPNDYVDVSDINALRKRLYEHYNSEIYYSCGHCRGSLGPAGASAAQGKLDFITLPQNVEPETYIPTELLLRNQT